MTDLDTVVRRVRSDVVDYDMDRDRSIDDQLEYVDVNFGTDDVRAEYRRRYE